MKRQKKYTSEEMITKDIYAAIRKRDRLNRQAECCDAEADLLSMADEPEHITEIQKLRDTAVEKRMRAVRINETRLIKLKNTLSAFKTAPLPGLCETNQVVLQSK